jgi:hypothetical protein
MRFLYMVIFTRKPKKPQITKALYLVGIAGFEPAISRPPDVRFTGLSYIPNKAPKLREYFYL